MNDQWAGLAKQHGRKSVMNLSITDAELDTETNRQTPILMGLIAGQLHGHERSGLDFGCGSGRFSAPLAKTIHGRVLAFDPCAELIAMATGHISVDYHSGESEAFFAECKHNQTDFDVVLTAMVLGTPGLDLEATASGLVSVLAPDGLLIIVDHMPEVLPTRRWWRYRPMNLYRDVFARNDVNMECVGELAQLENQITVLTGRRI